MECLAQLNHIDSQAYLGLMLYHGNNGVLQDHTKAKQLFKQVVDYGKDYNYSSVYPVAVDYFAMMTADSKDSEKSKISTLKKLVKQFSDSDYIPYALRMLEQESNQAGNIGVSQ